MKHLYKFMAAGLLLLLPFTVSAEDDISTVSIEKDGKVVETEALPSPSVGEGWIPKKVKHQCSLRRRIRDFGVPFLLTLGTPPWTGAR